MSTHHTDPFFVAAPAESPNSIRSFDAQSKARNKVVSFDDVDDLLSLNDVSIATSHKSEVRKIRYDRRHIVSGSTLIPKHGRSPSRGSSRGSQSGIEKYLDDPNFAPPPTVSISESRPLFDFRGEGGRVSTLPSYDNIRHSGYIMTRFSQASLLMRKWLVHSKSNLTRLKLNTRQNFWILYQDNLLFFRSKEDFDQWLMNPFLSEDKRVALVKRRLSFDNKSLKMYNLGSKRLKSYRSSGNMHHFKLDKHESFGGAISNKTAGAFASMNEVDVVELYTIIFTLLKPAQMNTFQDFLINYDGMSIGPGGEDNSTRPVSAGSVQSNFAAISF